MKRHANWVAVVMTIASANLAGRQPAAVGTPGPAPPSVDVTVLDGDGRPVRGLTASDFVVEVGRKRRPVTRAELVDFSVDLQVGPVTDGFEVTTNVLDAAGSEPRLVLVLVDDIAFSPAEGEAVFSQLATAGIQAFPGGLVGLATLSGRGPAVPFTRDRVAVADAMRRMRGRESPRPGTMSLAVSEVVEITRPTSDGRMLNETVNRVCAGLASPERLAQVSVEREACRQDVIKEARAFGAEIARDAQQRIGALIGEMEALSTLPGVKHVLLVSPGVPLDPSSPLLAEAARAAAAARAMLHALQVDRREAAGMEERPPSPRPADDDRLLGGGLEALALATGGAVHRLSGDPAPVLDRIRLETSALYRLTLEVDAAPARGGEALQVRVGRPGAVVRAPRSIAAPEDTRALPARERLGRALQSPVVERELGLRLATFAFREEAGRGHVLVSAEVEGGQGELSGGYVLRDAGREAVQSSELGPDAIIVEGDAPPLYAFRLSAPPGAYTLKLAVLDARGRLGSVIRAVTVPGPPHAGVALGDLLVLPEGGALERARPSAQIPQGTRRASVYFELYAEGLTAPEPASLLLEVADHPEGRVLFSTPAAIQLEPRNRWVATSGRIGFSPAALPPGRYLARLLVKGTEARAARSFTVTTAGSVLAAALPDEARTALPRFAVSEFLSPTLLRAVSARLAEHAEGNAAAQAATRSLEDGRWQEAEPVSGEPVVDATLRGLQLLSAGQPAEAEAAFRDALDADPEFTLALALAGGAWAAVGRDREATRSWRTALATGVDAPFLYRQVASALLRQGDVQGLHEFLEELDEIGADTAPLALSAALAAAIAGDRSQAARALAAWVDAHPNDMDAAFLLVLALYELKTIEKDPAALLEFEARARRYVEQHGPRAALVARWLK